MTGSAFVTVVDERMSAPNTGEPEAEMFQLAAHLGLDVAGFHTFADIETFNRLQQECWNAARASLDRGLPVFAKELDLGNETSLVYGYNDTGYFTHSWHAGTGHEGYDDVIPWTMLGRNYCPCFSCRTRALEGSWSRDDVFTGKQEEGGFISMHWVSPITPSDDLTALRAAIKFSVEFAKLGTYEWGGRIYYNGIAAYDQWIGALRNNTILAFYMGYYADIMHESRRYARLFLSEASVRFGGALANDLARMAEHYKNMEEEFRLLNNMFPWSQPHTPIDDPDRRQEAVKLLSRIRELEVEGIRMIEKLEETTRQHSAVHAPN